MAQDCSLSSILFSIFINDFLIAVEQNVLGILLSSGNTIRGMLFSVDFVSVSDSKKSMQKFIGVLYSYCSKNRDYEVM